MVVNHIPTWTSLNEQQLPAGTISVYCSCSKGVTTNGEWTLGWAGSLTLTIAQWEQKTSKTTRLHRYKSLAKIRLNNKNCGVVPAILEMISAGDIPKNMSDVNAYLLRGKP